MAYASSASSRLAALAAVAWGLFHLYRAALMAITCDEAFTFNNFVSVPWLDLLRKYDANHHVLHSILCKWSVGLLGPSELTLRLPALVGGWAYLFFALRLARHFAGPGPAMLASFLWMAGLPHIAEYLSLARGYSLALAFFAAALWYAVQLDPKWTRVSTLLGLSVASNLIFLIPSVALALVSLRSFSQLPQLIAPALVVALWTLAVPLQFASMDNYYFGARRWSDSFPLVIEQAWLRAMAIAALVLALPAAWRRPESRVLIWVLSLSFLGIELLFLWRSVPLPYGRTGIYLLALLALLVGPGVRTWERLELPLAGLFIAAAIGATVQLSPVRTVAWEPDAFSRAAIERIRQEAGGRNVSVAASFPLNHDAEFYRRILRLSWPAVTQWLPGAEADFVIWSARGERAPLPEPYQEVVQDPATGVIVGRRDGSALRPPAPRGVWPLGRAGSGIR